MARKARVQSKTGIYHIIIRGIEEMNVFAKDAEKERFLSVVERYKVICGYEVYGYAVLDNYVHLVIKENEIKLGNIMKRIGVKFVSEYNSAHQRTGSVFYDRFKSEVVESEEYLVQVLRFIHQEPVRFGAVMDINRYAYSSQQSYNKELDGLVDRQKVMEIFGGSLARFKRFMNELTDDSCMEANRTRISDEELAEKLLSLADVETRQQLKMLTKSTRNRLLREIKELSGASVWQLSRVSGFSQAVVANA